MMFARKGKTFITMKHSPLTVVILCISIMTTLVAGPANIIIAAGSAIYYVATDGDDNNRGTQSEPWRSIQKAADSLQPGETVRIRGGVYSEFVNINVSGNSQGAITFQNYPGEIPILDGSELEMTKSNQSLILLSNVNYITIKGLEIRNLNTSDRSFDPTGISIKNGGNNIQLLDNNIHHIHNTAKSGNAHGIHILGNTQTALTNINVQNNQLHHLKTGWSESLTLSGNIDGFSIVGNHIYNNNNIGIDLAGFYNACSFPCQDQVRNGVVSDNTVYRIDSSDNESYGNGVHAAGGIYADGAKDVVIERNTIYQSDFGIELASENQGRDTSNITVQNNFIHHNYGAGILLGGNNRSNGGSAHNLIVNNTFVENDTLKQGYGDITFQNNTRDNIISNNIIYTGTRKMPINKNNSTGSGNILDYNLIYNPDGLNKTNWKWEGVTYTSWSAYRKATGNDVHSLFGDPKFVNKEYNDIRLRAGSPAIDRGSSQYASSSFSDLFGEARVRGKSIDIGAAESLLPGASANLESIDWSKIKVLSKGNGKAKQLKAYKDETNLYIAIEGSDLNSKSQIYINADNNKNTGFSAPYWKNSGADFLLENGTLFRYGQKSGTKWSWTEFQRYRDTPNYIASQTFLAVSIPLEDIEATKKSVIRIGYVWNDSSTNALPSSGELTIVSLLSQ